MLINLLAAQPLGQWDINEHTSQLEFQFGGWLIYVQHPKGTSSSPALQAAQLQIQQVWDDMPNAIVFAEAWFRTKHPEFWNAWDKAKEPKYPLIAYSIAFCIGEDYPCYYIARDPCYEFEYFIPDEFDLWQQDSVRIELPYFPESDAVLIRRIGSHQFSLN